MGRVIKKEIRVSENSLKEIWNKVKGKDFTGNDGTAIKNSAYQFLTTLSLKIGSLIFVMVMARVLLPELFGLYGLTLSTILIFAAFAELSVGETLVRFVSRELGKRNFAKAKAYTIHFAKIKVVLTSAVIVILLLSAKFISHNYYDKPIYLALMAGGLYILFAGVAVTFQSILQAQNKFKQLFYRELFVQIARLILIPLLVIISLKNSFGNEKTLFLIVIGLAFTYLVSSITLYIFSRKTAVLSEKNKSHLTANEKRIADKFIFVSSATLLSGVFFGYIDIVILGYFVSSVSIGYYQSAFSFLSALLPLLSFSMALLPVFSRLSRKKLALITSKSLSIVSLVSFAAFLVLMLFPKLIILIVFGKEYLPAVNILRLFSFLLLSSPIITIYSTYFTSIGKPGIVTKALIWSTIANVVLNIAFIAYFIQFSELSALYGAAIATVISRTYYMILLFSAKRRVR